MVDRNKVAENAVSGWQSDAVYSNRKPEGKPGGNGIRLPADLAVWWRFKGFPGEFFAVGLVAASSSGMSPHLPYDR